MADRATTAAPAWTRAVLVVLALFLLFSAATGLEPARVRDAWTWSTSFHGTAEPANASVHALNLRLPASSTSGGLDFEVARATVTLHATGPPDGLPVRARLLDGSGQTLLVHEFDPRRPLASHEHVPTTTLASGAYEVEVTPANESTAYALEARFALPFAAEAQGARLNPFALLAFGLAALLAAAAPLLRRLARRPPP